MIKSCFIFLFLLVAGRSLMAQSTCREVVGYYPNWQWYDRNKLVSPESIHYQNYSILNYCFFKPEADGSISITDPWADKNLLLGPINWAVAPAGYDTAYDFGNPAYHQSGHQFSEICHQHGVKLLPSIGGWTLSENFPAIAADPQKRAVFVQHCVDLIDAFGFDGIDLDWEYPGFADHGGTAQDAANFTILLQEIRTAIDNYGSAHGKTMLLTAAVGAAADRMDDVQWDQVTPLLDIINLMSYDFFGAWDSVTNHNAPLYAPAQGDPSFNTHTSLQRLLNTYHVPANKITLGIPFYGRSVVTSGTPGLHVAGSGAGDAVTFATDEGTPLYYNLLAQMDQFSYHWDEQSQVPYLTGNGNLHTFVSFDDERSVAVKARYIVDNGLRGAIIWEITGDYLETTPQSGVIAGTPLADTLNKVFCHYQSGTAGLEAIDAGSWKVYPNPATEWVRVQGTEQLLRIELTDNSGKVVWIQSVGTTSEMKLDLTGLTSGIYHLHLFTVKGNELHQRIIIDKS